jgi:hypothetical protein
MSNPDLTIAGSAAIVLILVILFVAAASRVPPASRPTSHRASARPANLQPAWQPKTVHQSWMNDDTRPMAAVQARHGRRAA